MLSRTTRRTLLMAFLTAALTAGTTGAASAELSGIPAAFADVGVGARSVGLGGSVAAVAGAEALFWNPARLDPGEASAAAHVSYCDQMGLVPYSSAAGVMRFGDYAVAAGLLYSGDDVLTETTVLVGASRPLPGLVWCDGRAPEAGAALRIRRASFGNNESHEGQVTGTALGYALDVGAAVPMPGGTTLGLVWRDVVSSLSWDSSASGEYDESVPSVLSAGVAMTAADRLTIEAGLDKALDDDASDIASLGVELRLFEAATLRGGYRTSVSDDALEEFVAGAGAAARIGSATAGVDVAYVFGELESTLRMGLSVAWR